MWVLAKKLTLSQPPSPILPIVYQSFLVKVKGFGFHVPPKMGLKITVTFYVPLKFPEDIM